MNLPLKKADFFLLFFFLAAAALIAAAPLTGSDDGGLKVKITCRGEIPWIRISMLKSPAKAISTLYPYKIIQSTWISLTAKTRSVSIQERSRPPGKLSSVFQIL